MPLVLDRYYSVLRIQVCESREHAIVSGIVDRTQGLRGGILVEDTHCVTVEATTEPDRLLSLSLVSARRPYWDEVVQCPRCCASE